MVVRCGLGRLYTVARIPWRASGVLRSGTISGDRAMPDDLLFRNRYRIPSARLAGWDYRWAGVYSVTICTRGRVCWFGDVREGQVVLSPVGEVVAQEWRKIPRHRPRVTLDEWIVMPDHLHGILIFQGRTQGETDRPKHLLAQSLGAVIGRFKSEATKRIWWNLKQRAFAWQARFYDTILHDQADLDRLRAYIRENPSRWERRRKPNP
jgi:putative transposase